ncbi:MAG: hypothetical protein GY771_02515 [bacterium]|nr:hypothetical protein [bacterium]
MGKSKYRYYHNGEWFDVELPVCGGEALIIPNVIALIFRDEAKRELLLQRRDKPGETIRGKLEVPSGRWRAQSGETREPGWYDVEDVINRLSATPSDFAPPAFAVLSEYFSVVRIEETD